MYLPASERASLRPEEAAEDRNEWKYHAPRICLGSLDDRWSVLPRMMDVALFCLKLIIVPCVDSCFIGTYFGMKMGEHLTSDWAVFGDVKDGSAFFKFR